MSVSAPTPPLLLTKRLTAFLHSNLTPQVHTALLATLSGKLLAHASTQSVNTLRTQCTVAASLWAIYSAPEASDAIADSLPPHHQHHHGQQRQQDATPTKPSAITIQLTGAVVVLRLLRCGLLFVCFGPPPPTAPPSVEGGVRVGSGGSGGGSEHTTHSQQGQDRSNSNSNSNSSTLSQPSQQQQQQQQQQQSLLVPSQPPSEAATLNPNPNPTPTIGSPSEVASIKSAGGATVTSIATTGSVSTAGVVAVRRQAEELARWLDDKLGSLGVPEEGAAFESR
ncbi:hypothetical protein SLS62_010484 [Diatrype stigma]|uniref:Uncharacterized protein n=1 Tax=Diatrype stigma TaxID=117547 RepID=A0AAN9YH16_9PEZI